MRRFLAGLVTACLALLLLAAAPPSFLPTPTVVVYPLTVNGSDVDKESGSRLAVVIAQSMSSAGGVTVKPAPPGTERKNFLEIARSQTADYYIAGYVTPLGNDVSVVEQLQELADVPLTGDRIAQRDVGVDRVAVTTAVALAGDVP
ncbi:MAG: hypothetical protein ABR591_07225, partial [Candidatus Velthaea sp.]